MKKFVFLLAIFITSLASTAWAEGAAKINPIEIGTISRDEGLEAWARIYEVASHPRCANCHVGKSDRPMWSGPSYGKTRVHGMNIQAGDSRIGVETLLCSSCHVQTNAANDGPHMAPQVNMAWQLAPVEADWFGRSSDEICNQLRDPARNGERNYLDLAAHLDHDLILHWAWSPGGGREAAPYSLQEHVDDILIWSAAMAPCPSDEDISANEGNAELIATLESFLEGNSE